MRLLGVNGYDVSGKGSGYTRGALEGIIQLQDQLASANLFPCCKHETRLQNSPPVYLFIIYIIKCNGS